MCLALFRRSQMPALPASQVPLTVPPFLPAKGPRVSAKAVAEEKELNDPTTPSNNTYDTRKLEQELERDEGLRLGTYRCTAGYLTIGIGRNLDANPLTAAEQRACGVTSPRPARITREAATILFRNDIAKVAAQLDRALPWWREMSDRRQRAMINLGFNMGVGRRAVPGVRKASGLLSFTNTLAQIQRGDYGRVGPNTASVATALVGSTGACRGLLSSKYARDVKGRAVRVARMLEEG
jgi:lysozyme